MKCRDCLENLCDSCSAQHADGKHTCESLTEQKCDKHNQKLELYCIGCRCNICVVCFSETHRSHKCDAISKLAEQLINALKNDAEALRSCRSRLDAVLTNIMRQKKKYVRHLEECLNIRATGQRSGAAKEDPRLVNKQTKVHDLIKKKLKAANEMIQRNTADADINGNKVRGLIQDVSVILGVVILKLSNHVGRLQNVLSDIEKLQTTADDVIRSGFSAHEVTNNALTIVRLGKQINVLLQDRTLHPYLECSCKNSFRLYAFRQYTICNYKKLSYRRETAQCFVSLNITLSNSRSLKVIRNDILEKGVTLYYHLIVTLSVSCTVSATFSVIQWRDLEIWVWGRSRSLTMALFDRPYATFYWSAVVSITILYHFRVTWQVVIE